MIKKFIKDPFFWVSVLFYLASVILVGFMFSCCFNDGLWGDEGYSLALIEWDFSKLTEITLYDVHPPLYYYILKLFTSLGGDLVIMSKIVSVLPFVGVLVYGATFLRKDFGLFPASFITFILCSAPQYVRYSTEIRMYSWAIVFVAATLLHAYEVLDNPKQIKSWIWLGVQTVCAAYTNYFAALCVFLVWLCLFVLFVTIRRKQFIRFCITGVSAIAIYLPWAISYVKVSLSQFTSSPSGYHMLGKWRFFYAFIFGYAMDWYFFQFMLGGLFILILILSLIRYKFDAMNLTAIIGFGCFFVFFVGILLLPKFISHPVEYYYVLPGSPLVFLPVAMLTARLIKDFALSDLSFGTTKKVLSTIWNVGSKFVLPGVLFCCMTIGAISTASYQIKKEYEQAEAFAEYQQTILSQIQEGDYVVSRESTFILPILYSQVREANHILWQLGDKVILKNFVAHWNTSILREELLKGKRVFVFERNNAQNCVDDLIEFCNENGIPYANLGTWSQVDTVNCATSTIYRFGE